MRPVGDRLVYALEGDVDMVTSEHLLARVRGLAEPGVTLDLDLAGVGFMDSFGLRTLFRIHDAVTGAGGHLRLAHPSENVERLLEMTGTLDLFEVAPGG